MRYYNFKVKIFKWFAKIKFLRRENEKQKVVFKNDSQNEHKRAGTEPNACQKGEIITTIMKMGTNEINWQLGDKNWDMVSFLPSTVLWQKSINKFITKKNRRIRSRKQFVEWGFFENHLK